ncbi:conjugal transfer pilus assembly protein TraL [Sphingobium sp. B2D3A]|uniref:type IV conjugative transfer system protein TraL n=1 Tax=unclassified Sphingobium TaxID=2611147 RepID=UPI0022243F27|nr:MULTISPECIES: type IV conjugative transfer system protein TraL [unclassified Sphingobium]MCW2339184.1 conjugal transfer pilus assembly protein TraL [Sphingobium sp. B2D3A]MCW2386872.1 conjugal transfer pilus assembly protein TraL [Sphingobium sp. B2D3D]
MNRYTIPSKLDEPERIGPWTIDELVVTVGPFVVGIITQQFTVGIIAGALGWWGLRKAKAGRAGAWLINAAYWYLPSEVLKLSAVPPSYIRLMAG